MLCCSVTGPEDDPAESGLGHLAAPGLLLGVAGTQPQ